MRYLFFPVLLLLLSCENHSAEIGGSHVSANASLIDSTQNTVEKRFLPVDGFTRKEADKNSFAFYLRNLPLKKIDAEVTYYNGAKKSNNDVYVSVVDQEIDPVDLQQCADAVMRLRGEWLFAQKRFNDIHFNFLSDGKPHFFSEFAKGDYSYKNFRKYMKYIFSYANTGSLRDELVPVENIIDIQPGDVFVQKKTPYGHAVIVVDVIENKQGAKKYLLAQSYMPAQETQILLNPNESDFSPWYSVSDRSIITPEWRFEPKDLRRFKD